MGGGPQRSTVSSDGGGGGGGSGQGTVNIVEVKAFLYMSALAQQS